MNNSLQIDNKLLSCRVAYIPLGGERQEGFVRACWYEGNFFFLLELDRGGFTEALARYCKRIM